MVQLSWQQFFNLLLRTFEQQRMLSSQNSSVFKKVCKKLEHSSAVYLVFAIPLDFLNNPVKLEVLKNLLKTRAFLAGYFFYEDGLISYLVCLLQSLTVQNLILCVWSV